MKNSLTIAGKELAGYFLQPVAYVVMTVFLLLGGFFSSRCCATSR